MRGHKTLIQEAEALAMSPEVAYSFLKLRAGQSKDEGRNDHFDQHAEAALMGRADPLIDLALAQYCRHNSTAAALFDKAAPESPVRLAILTNRAMQAEIFNRFPVSLFLSKEKAAAWISQASGSEMQALFENPTLDDSFLQDLLKRSKPWDTLNDDRLSTIVAILTRNERMRTPRDDDYMDGDAEYSYTAVFNAAWKLAESVQPGEGWAMALGWLYDRLETDAFSINEPLALVDRWKLDPTDAEAAKNESKENESGWLSNRQRVRKGLGRLALRKSSKLLPELLSSEDVALRSAAYAAGQITVDQLSAGFARDDELFFNEAIHNPWLWRSAPARQALKDVAWSVVRKDKHSDLLAANIYNGIRKDKRKNHPDWFKDEEGDEMEMDYDEGPATRADLALLAQRLEQPTAKNVQLVEQLKQGLQTLNSRAGWIWWFSLGALVVSLRHF
jgi:hypothetical protein